MVKPNDKEAAANEVIRDVLPNQHADELIPKVSEPTKSRGPRPPLECQTSLEKSRRSSSRPLSKVHFPSRRCFSPGWLGSSMVDGCLMMSVRSPMRAGLSIVSMLNSNRSSGLLAGRSVAPNDSISGQPYRMYRATRSLDSPPDRY